MATPGPIARTAQGEVEGRPRDGSQLFAGIPYAAPPTGERRFRPPEPHAGWSGVRSARRFGLAAPQRPGVGLTAAPLEWDEDCLTLNVCTPAADDGLRPVLVWIHGGAFRTGKGGIPWYDGGSFAKRGDVVTVSINYRLGALGWAHVGDVGGPDFDTAGVSGLLDQIAALRWVRDNIAAFGGDPARVTIAGESAGAMSVGTLLGCPAAKGLFRRAIAQSGAAHNTLPDDWAREIGREFARRLGADDAAGLRAADVEQVLEAQVATQEHFIRHPRSKKGAAGDMVLQPAVGSAVLPEAPIEAIRAGLSSDVPVLHGTNLDETTLWGYGKVDEARLARFGERFFDARGAEAIETYRKARPDATPEQLVIAMTSDHMFRIPAIRLAEAHAGNGGRNWSYLFTWRSRALGGRLGATHALEIPFAFDNLQQPGIDAFLGKGGPDPQPLADAMHRAWIAFVRDGDPGWDAYDTDTRSVMEFGERVVPHQDPYGAERALWQGLR
ncbi:MAG: carboxylesterase/lipase family protein [Myxococcota bacterium]